MLPPFNTHTNTKQYYNRIVLINNAISRPSGLTNSFSSTVAHHRPNLDDKLSAATDRPTDVRVLPHYKFNAT